MQKSQPAGGVFFVLALCGVSVVSFSVFSGRKEFGI